MADDIALHMNAAMAALRQYFPNDPIAIVVWTPNPDPRAASGKQVSYALTRPRSQMLPALRNVLANWEDNPDDTVRMSVQTARQ